MAKVEELWLSARSGSAAMETRSVRGRTNVVVLNFGELAMECPVTGIKTRFGNRVSHANNKTRRTWEPNMQSKRIWVPNENRFVRLRLSAQGIKMIDKVGIEAVLIDLRKRGIRL